MSLILSTPQLEMRAATLELVTADLHHRDDLPALLNAELGEGWPPVLLDVRAMEWLKQSLIADPALGGWTAYYGVLHKPCVLIGMAGFKSRPVNGAVELGYGVLEKFQRQGFATEMVNAMTNWAFAQGVEKVLAQTLPELIASQRVLEKAGFNYVGEGSEPGVMRYERRREES